MAKQYFYSDLTPEQKTELTDGQTEVFKLKEEGKSWDEIAMLRGTSVASARAIYFQGKTTIKKIEAGEKELTKDGVRVKPLSLGEMADACDTKAGEILQLMTKESIQKATLAQKAQAFGVLIEKGRLLRGESTQIITHDDRRTLKDMLPALMKEVEKRGLTLEGEFEVGEPA
jgi:hypothetical protein